MQIDFGLVDSTKPRCEDISCSPAKTATRSLICSELHTDSVLPTNYSLIQYIPLTTRIISICKS